MVREKNALLYQARSLTNCHDTIGWWGGRRCRRRRGSLLDSEAAIRYSSFLCKQIHPTCLFLKLIEQFRTYCKRITKWGRSSSKKTYFLQNKFIFNVGFLVKLVVLVNVVVLNTKENKVLYFGFRSFVSS